MKERVHTALSRCTKFLYIYINSFVVVNLFLLGEFVVGRLAVKLQNYVFWVFLSKRKIFIQFTYNSIHRPTYKIGSGPESTQNIFSRNSVGIFYWLILISTGIWTELPHKWISVVAPSSFQIKNFISRNNSQTLLVYRFGYYSYLYTCIYLYIYNRRLIMWLLSSINALYYTDLQMQFL